MLGVTYRYQGKQTLRSLLLPKNLVSKMMLSKTLVWQLILREIYKRYKGTLFGLLWSFLTPLLMLSIYTVVFGFVFSGSYHHSGESRISFVLGLFCSLLIWEFIGNTISSSTTLITNNQNLVTKVIFPLEILSLASLVANLIHTLIGFLPLFLLIFWVQGKIVLQILWILPIFVPLLLYALGVSWVVSALSVFFRDISALIPSCLTALMFGSAIFFPISSVPPAFRWIIQLNPVAELITLARDSIVFGVPFSFSLYFYELLGSLLIAFLGYVFFLKFKLAFADEL